MRRIILLFTAAALIAVVFVASAMPVFGAAKNANCIGRGGQCQ